MRKEILSIALVGLTGCSSLGFDLFRPATSDSPPSEDRLFSSRYAYHVIEPYTGADPQPFFITAKSISFDEREYWVEGRKLCRCSGPHSLKVTAYDDGPEESMRSFGEYIFRDARHKKSWSVPVPKDAAPSTILRLYGECIEP